ncbi:MAG: hypothetical protein WBB83_18720, partial [Candidatus Microthrix parvicella]
VTVHEASGAAGTGTRLPDRGPVVGTEAVLHRAGSADLVVFLDIDQELLAPRYRAADQALALLARGARLVGSRSGGGGRIIVASRIPDHVVLRSVALAQPGLAAAAETERRAMLGYPPFGSVAEVAGAAATAYIERLRQVLDDEAGSPPEVQVINPADGRWLVRAADAERLCGVLAEVERPPGRLRLRVDPMRL